MLSFGSQPNLADPIKFWLAILIVCLENGRWQAAISSFSHNLVCLIHQINISEEELVHAHVGHVHANSEV